MTDLQMKWEAPRAKLAEVDHSSIEVWKNVMQGAQSALNELEWAFQDA